MLAAAIGDALGWPNEQNSNNLNKHYNELNAFVEWSRNAEVGIGHMKRGYVQESIVMTPNY